jgi:hypothetical protein
MQVVKSSEVEAGGGDLNLKIDQVLYDWALHITKKKNDVRGYSSTASLPKCKSSRVFDSANDFFEEVIENERLDILVGIFDSLPTAHRRILDLAALRLLGQLPTNFYGLPESFIDRDKLLIKAKADMARRLKDRNLI